MHGQLDGLDPSGADIVLIAGDFAPLNGFTRSQIQKQAEWVRDAFCEWCSSYPKTQFRLTPGNHDLFAQRPSPYVTIKWPANTKMLIDQEDDVSGLRIYGSPWIPFINGAWAFEEVFPGHLKEKFEKIPCSLDILITHSPPKIRHKKIDVSIDRNTPHFGSPDLTDAICRAKPKIALCGHIHTGDHNPLELNHPDGSKTILRNVSRLDEEYKIRYEPCIFEL